MAREPEWRFPPIRRDFPLTDPIAEEFFTTDSVGGLAEALVREAIQNSLDARLCSGKKPVAVVFNFHGRTRRVPHAQASKYLHGLKQHVVARECGLRGVPNIDGPVSYVSVEDFGTTGLEGSTEEHDNVDEHDSHAHGFFWFWRNIGRSAKSMEDLGRWGLGKTVFPATSSANCFFGVSKRASDGQMSLLGQCVLKTHRVGDAGVQYAPYGYFGCFGTAAVDEYYALPVTDSKDIERFCADFSLSRGEEPGFSVVIPFPDDALSADDVTASVVRQWFYPIITGRLVVSVKAGSQEVRLDAANLDGALASLTERLGPESGESLVNLMTFAKWAVARRSQDLVTVSAPSDGAPRWDDVRIPDSALERLRRDYQHGDPVALRAQMLVSLVDGKPTLTHFDVFIQKDEGLSKCDDHFVRAGITLSNVHSRMSKGVRCLVVVDDAPLRTLLGDAENPAHTEWHKESRKFRGRYTNGSSTIDFVKNSVREVARLLSPAPQSIDTHALEDVFYIDDMEIEEEEEDDTDKAKGRTSRRRPRKSTQQQFYVSGIEGGIRISFNQRAGAHPPVVLVRIAYMVRRGNPFRRYNKLDFDVGNPPIQVAAIGATVLRAEGNEVEASIQQAGFSLSVTGFDQQRDLRVYVRGRTEAA